MTDSYLRSLGFAPTEPAQGAGRTTSGATWRYQHEHMAQDGALLFVEHPLGIAGCRLSALAAPLAAHDVFATVSLLDEAGLSAATAAYFAAHGGVGPAVPVFVPHTYLPYRRQR